MRKEWQYRRLLNDISDEVINEIDKIDGLKVWVVNNITEEELNLL